MIHDREKITQLREKAGLAINELARRAGIKGPSLHAIETGKTKRIKSTTLVGLANALGVPMQDLLKGTKGKNGQDLGAEAAALFNRLSERDQLAMLAAMRSLGSNKKP